MKCYRKKKLQMKPEGKKKKKNLSMANYRPLVTKIITLIINTRVNAASVACG